MARAETARGRAELRRAVSARGVPRPAPAEPRPAGPISSERVAALARGAGFDLVGFARAEPIPARVLGDWLEAGYHADLDWLAEQRELRLDVERLFPGAKTVVALACNYWRSDEPSPVARYARGRDYHHTLRDRLRALRRALRAELPFVFDYGSADANPVMERVWAVRAGLGFIGKSGCLITPEYGSWVVLAALVLDAEVDSYAAPPAPSAPGEGRCGACQLCVVSCPTGAIVGAGVVDSRLCLSYHTVENEAAAPTAVREASEGWLFGCDVCQAVCPLNAVPVLAGERFAEREIARRSAVELAAMSRAQYDAWVPGTALARAGYDGLRRNAAHALGAARDTSARPVLEALAVDASPVVSDAARWALGRLRG